LHPLSTTKLKNMSKQTQSFTFITPYIWGNKNPQRIDIEISGLGYYYGNLKSEPDSYDFDIETVKANGKDFTEVFRALESDCDSRMEEHITNATKEHMFYVFEQSDYAEIDSTDIDQDTPTNPVQSLQNGNFSSSNLLAAIGDICRDYNTQILNNKI